MLPGFPVSPLAGLYLSDDPHQPLYLAAIDGAALMSQNQVPVGIAERGAFHGLEQRSRFPGLFGRGPLVPEEHSPK